MLSLIIATAITTARGATTSLFLSTYEYMRLTGTERDAYVKTCRDVFAEFERRFNQSAPGIVSLDLLPRADAADETVCPIGGVFITRRAGRCSTFGRNCGGRSDGFLCGKLYNNQCVDRQPVATLSERCNENAGPLTPEAYAQFSSVIDHHYPRACTGARATSPACGFIRDRMASANTHARPPEPVPPPAPRPPPKPIDPTPEPAKPDDKSFSAIKEGACQRDRNQGKLRTCHAFCVTCVYDNAMANATGKTDFKVSANWISMLSVIKRICDDPDSQTTMTDQILKKGWFADSNINGLATVGGCSEASFPPYRGTENWAEQFRTESKYVKMNDRKLGTARGLNPALGFSESERRKWRDNFAIEPSQAQELFCPKDKSLEASAKDYPVNLARMKDQLSPAFVKCAEEALRNKARIHLAHSTSASCDSKSVAPGTTGVADVKRLLHEANGPIPATITTSTDGHEYHCVTITGYDDAKRVFKTINSWGKSEEYKEIPYDQPQPRILFATSADCAIVSNRQTSAAAGGSAGTTR